MTIPTRHRRSLWLRLLLAPLKIVAFIVAVPATILGETILRGRCRHCRRRGLRGVRVNGDADLHAGDARPLLLG